MRTVYSILILLFAASACETRTPVDKLSFEELTAVVTGCQKTGKIATDHYCKEAAAVWAPENFKRLQAARIKEHQADDYSGAVRIPRY